ncbi:hypothetical protein HNO88_001230 [Novosphingobium chloroacetimidivorans]|uniref:Uncharacterized protein n=1 Tax=Novosphingobium chloroacetimidivorans TaxID=1428314 RepID=A0A7W7NV68_9SPHN|nr:hypothetical protein [Novosphingobium chloroacetimidivorans]MBB4857916.1 hypothetical protein [Novosphingobium chloroacetimidivorans]
MSDTLAARIATALARPVVPEVRAFAERLADGRVHGVLFYGSNLRTGLLEGVLDFYVLTTGPIERGIWPRVSYHEWEHEGVVLRAKVATMTLATFAAAAAGRLLDTTIWARFVQPSALAWSRDEASALAIRDAVAQAAQTAARLAVALGPNEGTADAYWRALFRATYAAEFRVERGGREESILAANREHFDGLLPLALDAQGIGFSRDADGTLRPALAPSRRAALLRWWARRQRLGKPYNLVRLIRASTTFEGAARYGAWKIERHTGVPVKLTPWREKHPVLAAPAVLWQVWRARQAKP